MSKSTNTATPAQGEAPVDVTLDEFCQRLSITDRRVELINGFHSVEVKDGRIKDTDANFTARFLAFINKPV